MMIRTAGPADAAVIRDLTRAAYAKWVPLIGREPRPMTVDYERAVRDHRIDLLEDAGVLVGLIEMQPESDHLWIENLAVAPAQHGKGFGRFLMAHAEAIAVKAELPELRLLTNGAFAANIRLYQQLGFTIDREEPYLAGTTVYMSKRLGA